MRDTSKLKRVFNLLEVLAVRVFPCLKRRSALSPDICAADVATEDRRPQPCSRPFGLSQDGSPFNLGVDYDCALKKALSFEAVRLASKERVQERPHLERISQRFGEQNEMVEVTKISGKNQILQRTGDQILKRFAQDRVQQRLVEQRFVPQMMEQ